MMITPKKRQGHFKYLDLGEIAKKSMAQRVLVCDIETTGLDPLKDLIVEVGLVLIDLKTGAIEKCFDQVVREASFGDAHKKAWVFANSDLKFGEVQSAPLLLSVKEEIQNYFNRFPATAYNKQFDFGFLRQRGIKIPYELDCPMQMATPILKIPHWKSGYKYPSVEEAWRYYFPTIKYLEKHRAYDDAMHEAQIVRNMYQNNQWQYRAIKDFLSSNCT